MAKFQVGDIVRPNKDFAKYNLWTSFRYRVLEEKHPNYRLECIDAVANPTCHPHEVYLDLAQSASANNPCPPAVPAQVSAFQPGDLVKCLVNYGNQFTAGNIYTVKSVIPGSTAMDYIEVVADDQGHPNSWGSLNFTMYQPVTTLSFHSYTIPAGQISIDPIVMHDTFELEGCKPAEKSPEEAKKERIWRALQSAAKQ